MVKYFFNNLFQIKFTVTQICLSKGLFEKGYLKSFDFVIYSLK